MKYVWIKYEGEPDWQPLNSYADNDENSGTTVMTECQADMQSERDDGNKVKLGDPFPQK